MLGMIVISGGLCVWYNTRDKNNGSKKFNLYNPTVTINPEEY